MVLRRQLVVFGCLSTFLYMDAVPIHRCVGCGDVTKNLRSMTSELKDALSPLLLPSSKLERPFWCHACRVPVSKIYSKRNVRTKKGSGVGKRKPIEVLVEIEKVFKRRRVSVGYEQSEEKSVGSTPKVCKLCELSKENIPQSGKIFSQTSLTLTNASSGVTKLGENRPSELDTVPASRSQKQSAFDMKYYPLFVSVKAVCNTFNDLGDDFFSEFVRRRRLVGELFTEDMLRKIINPQTLHDGWICTSHYQALRKAKSEIDKIPCAVCFTFVSKSNAVPLSSAYNDKNMADRLFAIENFISLRPVRSLDFPSANNNTREWLDRVLDALRRVAGTTIDSTNDDFGEGIEQNNEDIQFHDDVLDILRSGRACRSCFHQFYRNCLRFSATRNEQSTVLDTKGTSADPISPSEPDLDTATADSGLLSYCEGVAERLNDTLGMFETSVDLYRRYVDSCTNPGDCAVNLVASMRTLKRVLSEKFGLMNISSSVKGEGSLVMSMPTAAQIIVSAIHGSSSTDSISPAVERALLAEVALRYKNPDVRQKFQSGDWNLVDEIKQFPPLLWRHYWLLQESTRDIAFRKAEEKKVGADLSQLSWPFSNGPAATEESFKLMNQHWFRKCIKTFSVLQQLVFHFDERAPGPFIWGLSFCALSSARKSLLKVLNSLGCTVSYDSVHRLQNQIAQEEISKPLRAKVVDSMLLKVAWDNIDARLASNVARLVGKCTDWHGTILVSLQMPHTSPLLSQNSPQQISRTAFPTAASVITSLTNRTSAVEHFNVVLAAVVAVFRQNLLSRKTGYSVSLDFLLKMVLKGYSTGLPAVIGNLVLADRSSNSPDTAEYLMQKMQTLVNEQSNEANDPSGTRRYVVMACDAPLFAQMCHILFDGPNGERNDRFPSIIPWPGMMHQAMAYQEVVKFVMFDAVMDGLALAGGLSPGLAQIFRKKKEYKTNLRFFRQTSVVLMLRTLDALFDDAHLREDMPVLQTFGVKKDMLSDDNIPSLEELFTKLKNTAAQDQKVTEKFSSSLSVNEQLFSRALQDLGETIVKAIRDRGARGDDPNLSFFAVTALLETLNPSLCLHYVSRAGQLKARQDVVRHMMPLLFTTRKTNYMMTAIWQARLELEMSPDLHEQLLAPGGTCTNISGGSDFGNLDDDEANEMMGVRETKQGAATNTFKSLSVSFNSNSVLARARKSMEYSIGGTNESEPDEPDSSVLNPRNLRDSMKVETKNIWKMYMIASSRKSPTGKAFLGPEHRASAVLVNPLVKDELTLSELETERMIRRYEIGKQGAADLFGRIVRPFRATNQSRKATRAYTVYGFVRPRENAQEEASVKKRDKAIAQNARLLTASTKQVARLLDECADYNSSTVILEHEKRKVSSIRTRIMSTIDIVVPRNMAMRDSGRGEAPRRGSKSQFYSTLNEVLCPPLVPGEVNRAKVFTRQPMTNCPEFHVREKLQIDPAVRENGILRTQTIVAVDVSNSLHSPPQLQNRMFLSDHAHYLADRVAGYYLAMANRHGTTVLELHIDDRTRVPKQKSGVQAIRDESRQNGNGQPASESMPSQPVTVDMDKPITGNWAKDVLGNRELKQKWGNVLMAACMKFCAKTLLKTKNPEVTVYCYGAYLFVTEEIVSDGIYNDNEIFVAVGEGGCAIVHRRGDGDNRINETDERIARSKCWCLRYEQQDVPLRGRVVVWQDPRRDCGHGEAETRMQYTLSHELKLREHFISRSNTNVVQASKDTDNVTLALFSFNDGGLKHAKNVYVCHSSSYYNIKLLCRSIHEAGIHPETIGRLYCLAGNDFNPACAVASNSVMVRVFCAASNIIGSLRTAESCKLLYYYCFAACLNGEDPGTIPAMFNDRCVMSAAWKSAIRKYIFFHPKTKSVSMLLPQDVDLELNHCRGNVFLAEKYWIPASKISHYIDLPLGLAVGTDESGRELLEFPAAAPEREAAVKFKNSKCACQKEKRKKASAGATASGEQNITVTCTPLSPGSFNCRCSCFKQDKFCFSHCECDPIRCGNRPGGIPAALQRIERFKNDRLATAMAPRVTESSSFLQRILNSTTESINPGKDNWMLSAINDSNTGSNHSSVVEARMSDDQESNFGDSTTDTEREDENNVLTDPVIIDDFSTS